MPRELIDIEEAKFLRVVLGLTYKEIGERMGWRWWHLWVP